VAGQLETFLRTQQQRERPVPRFVEREFRSYLECGIPAYGFSPGLLRFMWTQPYRGLFMQRARVVSFVRREADG
jgi:hypothetical protein